MSKSFIMMRRIEVYTDGSCCHTDGCGGWGVLIDRYDEEGHWQTATRLYGGATPTTNNKMELNAVIQALKYLYGSPEPIHIYVDSKYVKDGATKWIKGWINNGWRTASKAPVKNEELWRALHALLERKVVFWHWIKGHDGNIGNEIADELARQGSLHQKTIIEHYPFVPFKFQPRPDYGMWDKESWKESRRL